MDTKAKHQEAMDEFISVQKTSSESLSSICERIRGAWEIGNAWRNPRRFLRFLANAYYVAMILIALSLAFAWLVPKMWALAPTQHRLGTTLIVTSVWLAITLMPMSLAKGGSYKVKLIAATTLLLLLIPVPSLILDGILNYFTEPPRAGVLTSLSSYPSLLILLFELLLLVLVLIILVTSSMSIVPTFVVLFASNRPSSDSSKTLLTHDEIIKEIFDESYCSVQDWSKSLTKRVEYLSSEKSQNRNNQLLAISLPLALLTLAFAVARTLTLPGISDSSLIRVPSTTVIILVLILIAAVLVFCWYINEAYKAAYIHEAVNILCRARLDEIELWEQETEQQVELREGKAASYSSLWATLKALVFRHL